MFEKVPGELTERRQWVNWKTVTRDNRPTKIPFKPDGTPARSDDPTTWSDFDDCVKVENKFSGIGYVFSAGDNFCGIDFDACYDPDTKQMSDWAKLWIKKLNSYSEISPSGTGVKVWVIGKFPFGSGKNVKLPELPRIKGKMAGIEAYDHKRYFAVTGNKLSGLSEKCEPRQEELNELYNHFFTVDAPAKSGGGKPASPLSIIERARLYLQRVPGAISGQGGHNQTFKAACVLVHGFDLGQTEALILMSEWNGTCEPPWTEKELIHKVESADKQIGDRPRGYLIGTKKEEWETYVLPTYSEPSEALTTRPVLAVDNTKLKLTDADMERLAIIEESSPDGHGFMETAEGMYRLSIPEYHIVIEIDRLRRESNELIGEMVVKCGMPGVRSFDGALSVGDINVSSVRARVERARMLNTRTNFGKKEDDIDWIGIVEEFCQRVILKERAGNAYVPLKDVELGSDSEIIKLPGLVLPLKHPTILFGDGGSGKSYVSLYFAGLIAQMGINVALFDWELDGESHRQRLELLFPEEMPNIIYARCERGITHEVDRLRRIVKDQNIGYAIYDSVAFACGGRPEEAEIAGAYFRAIRQIGVGGLNVAHISKAEGADQKPLGSAFWHNGARATWFVKSTQDTVNSNVLHLGLFNRKSNLAKIQKDVGYRLEFSDYQTYLTPENVADTPELAEKMSLSQKMKHILKSGPMTPDQISSNTGVPVKRVNEAARRNTKMFVIEGGKVANLYRG